MHMQDSLQVNFHSSKIINDYLDREKENNVSHHSLNGFSKA